MLMDGFRDGETGWVRIGKTVDIDSTTALGGLWD
jgi:hypothetical protein